MIRTVLLLSCSVILFGDARHLCAQLPAPYFYDGFDDGDAADGQPVKWLPFKPFVEGSRTVVSDSYVLVPPEDPPMDPPGYDLSLTEVDSTPEGVLLRDGSIRMSVRAQEPGEYWTGAFARSTFDERALFGSNVGVTLSWNGNLSVYTIENEDFVTPDSLTILRQVFTGLDALADDVHMQIDLFGQDISVTAWRDGRPKPQWPQIEVAVHSRFVNDGPLGVWSLAETADFDKPTAVRYFAVLPNPESPTMPGDITGDFHLDAADIDKLSAALRDGDTSLRYDSNYDGKVDIADHEAWAKGIKRTWFGDSNLDGEFNSADLVAVFSAGEYEDAIEGNSGWAEGDWNADGNFDSGDLVVAFTDGGFEQGPNPIVNAVPESTSFVMLITGLVGIAIRRRLVAH